MTNDATAQPQPNTLLGLGSSDGLGLLPEREGQPRTLTMAMPWEHERGHWYSPTAVREMLAAERERCSVLTDEMLRYAMAAMGTGSPKEAQRLRLFWRFAMEARGSGPNFNSPTP